MLVTYTVTTSQPLHQQQHHSSDSLQTQQQQQQQQQYPRDIVPTTLIFQPGSGLHHGQVCLAARARNAAAVLFAPAYNKRRNTCALSTYYADWGLAAGAWVCDAEDEHVFSEPALVTRHR